MKMKMLLAFALVLTLASSGWAKLNVVATLPDFGAIAREIGGDHINITTLARGTEDPHFVDARPSFVRVLNQADVLLEGGADLEAGWLPPLLTGARNAKIRADGPGRVVMARGISLLEIHTGPIDRSMGDVHPGGNPHYWLDPANGKIMAGQLAEVFSKLDAANADAYRANLKKFSERLDQKIIEWTKTLEPYRGAKVVTYHKTYEYFAGRFGFSVVGQIEPKPGIEPSATHINALIPRMKQEGVKLLLIEPNRPRRTPGYLAKATQARLILLPDKVGAHEKVTDYIGLFDYNVAQIVAALKESK